MQILYKAYAIGLGGYPGKTKTLDLFNRQYYWKEIADNIRKYIADYLFYIKIMFSKLLPAGLLKLLPLFKTLGGN